jgi:glycerate 2-kinase
VPAEVARRAKPVIALAGTIGVHAQANYDVGIDAFTGILPGPIGLEAALRRSAEFLTDATERVLRLVLVGTAIAT